MKHIASMALAGIMAGAAQSAAPVAPPAPHGALPSARQLAWHELEYYGFVHFSLNTFTGREWGMGDESPSLFAPTDFDAGAIADIAVAAGMKGLILTAKHHDGFCLWPTDTTDRSVRASPWKDGQGDVVKEFADACRARGLKFGIYLSPWDRNHPEYGRPAYLDVYRKQLEELCTRYGPVFEIWMDGANGGDGYYGGARETRTIDRQSYYRWEETWALMRAWQPDAVLFSDIGPDIRWVGNESGFSHDPSWATYTPVGVDGRAPAPGDLEDKRGMDGTRDGKHWMPAECDVSIRPGWFWRASENHRVKSPDDLMNLYYRSVGLGGSFLLNVPPDRRGRIHERDEASLRALGRRLRETFSTNLAAGATAIASNTRGGAASYTPAHVADGRAHTYWATDDGVTNAWVELRLPRPVRFNVVSLREFIALGQRADTWALDVGAGDAWKEIAAGRAIGARRLWKGEPQTADRVRLRVSGPVAPAIREFALHWDPGTEADAATSTGERWRRMDRAGWKVLETSGPAAIHGSADHAIDGRADTLWHTSHENMGEQPPPQSLTLDLGREKLVRGFVYLPRQDGHPTGIADRYIFEVSEDGRIWGPASKGEFSNIRNNPVEQVVSVPPVRGRFARFTIERVVEGRHVTCAEWGVLSDEP